ncbi:hypothetical protein ACIA5G_13120 [Amycolatopsis sp. NPDC051758]|uniref:hypothetical protein n=1 Tax=Amycolatopsis sp. NPDC051758 TaxID=3363935 RepID=UPI0037A6F409
MTGPRKWPPADATDPFTLTGEQRRQAVRVVASASHDADDCVELLAVLGLSPAEGRPADDGPPEETPVVPRRWRSSPQARRR